MNADEFDEAFDLGSDLMDSLDLLTESRMNAIGCAIKQSPKKNGFELADPTELAETSEPEKAQKEELAECRSDPQSNKTHDNPEDDIPLLDSIMQVSVADFTTPRPPSILQSSPPEPTADSQVTSGRPAHQPESESIAKSIEKPELAEQDAHSMQLSEEPEQTEEPQQEEMAQQPKQSAVAPDALEGSSELPEPKTGKTNELSSTSQLVDFPAWMIESLDQEANRLGVTRDAIIKIWIAERLDHCKSIAR